MPIMVRDSESDGRWFAVRCVFRGLPGGTYEERITLWRATSANLDRSHNR